MKNISNSNRATSPRNKGYAKASPKQSFSNEKKAAVHSIIKRKKIKKMRFLREISPQTGDAIFIPCFLVLPHRNFLIKKRYFTGKLGRRSHPPHLE